MSNLRSYKLPFEQYCINQEKINKLDRNLKFICNDCGICYTAFHENCDVAIILEKYYEKERKELKNCLTTTNII